MSLTNLNHAFIFQNAKNNSIQTLSRAHPILFALISFTNEELYEMDPALPAWVQNEIRVCSKDKYMRILLIRAGIEPNPGPGVLDRAVKIRSKKNAQQSRRKPRKQIPLNVSRQTPSRNFSVRGSNSQDVYISKREYVGQFITTTTAFSLLGQSANSPGYDGNPACEALFPWLSAVAGAFEKYTFTKLKIELVGAASAMTGGNFYACWDYDYDDTPATSGMQLLSNKSSIRCAPFQSASITLDVKNMNMDMPSRYVMRPGRVGPETRTTYCGYLMLASEGVPVGTSVAVYVDYQVKLMIPCLESPQIQTFLTPTTNDTSTSNYRFMPLGSISPGQLTIAVPGVNNVPPVAVPVVGVPAALLALGNATSGLITVSSTDVVTGSTPTALSPGTYVDAACIDRNGTTLGYLTNTISPGQSACGATSPASWSTSGASLTSLLSTTIQAIKTQFPNTVYLAPFVAKASAFAAGTKLWQVNYSL